MSDDPIRTVIERAKAEWLSVLCRSVDDLHPIFRTDQLRNIELRLRWERASRLRYVFPDLRGELSGAGIDIFRAFQMRLARHVRNACVANRPNAKFRAALHARTGNVVQLRSSSHGRGR